MDFLSRFRSWRRRRVTFGRLHYELRKLQRARLWQRSPLMLRGNHTTLLEQQRRSLQTSFDRKLQTGTAELRAELDKLVKQLTTSGFAVELERDSFRRDALLFRVIVTVDLTMMQRGHIEWGNDSFLLKHICDRFAWDLRRELTTMNALRMSPGERLPIAGAGMHLRDHQYPLYTNWERS